MDEDDCEDAWQAITVIEAQSALVAITVGTFAEIKQSDREKIHRRLHSQAYPDSLVEKKPLSAEHLQRILGG